MTTKYVGRVGTNWDNVTVMVMSSSGVHPLTHHVKHSPSGFSWGYCGSGPAELARCLLIDALGEGDPEPRMYQQFKEQIVAQWPPADWEINREGILEWVAAYRETSDGSISR